MAQFKEGDRVQLHPATDRWMQGDQYDDVVQVSLRMSQKIEGNKRIHKWKYKVLLDKSEDKIWFKEEDLQAVEP